MNRSLKLYYASGDAYANIKDNIWTTLLSSLTMGFSLAILAIFIIIFVNLNTVVSGFGERTHIVAYLKADASESYEDITSFTSHIEGIRGVIEVKYVSRDVALDELKDELKEHSAIFEGVEPTLLPASFEVMVSDEYREPEMVKKVVGAIGGFSWVDEVQYGQEWLEKLSSLLGFFEVVAVFIGLFLAAAVLFIISNTIRLTIYSRKREIEVMRLIGASNAFIKVPFLIEGFVLGIAGGLLAMVMLFLGQYFFILKIPLYFSFVVENPFNLYLFLAFLLLSGTLMGTVGSLFSLGKFLKVDEEA
jgi:cell division transport system permease protein